MATRLYFSAATAADVSPAFNAGWVGSTQAVRRKLLNAKRAADTDATGTTIDLATADPNDRYLDRQFVSDPMLAGITLTGMTTTGQLKVREYNALDDTAYTAVCISVVSSGGVVTNLATVDVSASGLEFINNATHRNSTLAGRTLGAHVTSVGDRLIVEIGFAAALTGVTPQASARYGSGDGAIVLASDLAVDETDTTVKAPWIEFSGTIGFAFTQTVNDSVTFSDASVKAPGKVVADTVTFSDTPTSVNSFVRALADTVTFSDTPTPVTGFVKVLADTVTFSDANVNAPGKVLAETITFSDTPGPLAVGVVLADTITFSDTSGPFAVGKVLADTVTFSDSVTKTVGMLIADTLTLNDVITPVTDFLLSFSDTITFSDANSLSEINYSDIPDHSRIRLGTILGLMLAETNLQKLGFWGADPVVQPAAIADATGAGDIVAQFNTLLAELRAAGLLDT